jgi:formylglycine-generating enzyme required for sulfatase activity
MFGIKKSQPVPPDMVLITGGTFMMGSPDSEAGRWENEGPQHQVKVRSFLLGKCQITQAEYEAVMEKNPSKFRGAKLPAENVAWICAAGYCNIRSEKEGLTPVYDLHKVVVTWKPKANGYRLPTEAEWEYACRAGTTTPYSSGDSVDNAGWYGANSEKTTHEVGTKEPNAWGLYDMHGNVWEWVFDWRGDYSDKKQSDPAAIFPGTLHVFRGGGFGDEARYLRSAVRGGDDSLYEGFDLGFRVCRTI